MGDEGHHRIGHRHDHVESRMRGDAHVRFGRRPGETDCWKQQHGAPVRSHERAIVLSVDEKSQIQALDRTQPSLPMKPGRAGTMTHDYKRNGTTTLFAALDVLTGSVIGQCLPRHRHAEFLTFLRTVDREVDKDLQIHLILDNYATHKHPNVNAWLEKHPRFHLHFTPTSSSWLNLVEGFFSQLTNKAIRRGVFASVPDLIAAIDAYLAANNTKPTPFTWTKTAEQIIEKVQRGRVTLNAITS
jgi:transposase